MSDLRECPFCGKPPVLLAVTEESDSFVRRYEIRCDNCRISLSGEYESEAAELWNTRAALAQPEAVEPVAWAVSRWNDEVSHRPLRNVNRRPLDDTWRQVIRHFGGDDEQLCGPRHDQLVEENPDAFTTPPIAPDERMRRALEKAEELYQLGILNAPDGLSEEVVRLRREALSRADEGKYDPAFVASIKAAQAAEPEAVFDNADAVLTHLFGANEGKESDGGGEAHTLTPEVLSAIVKGEHQELPPLNDSSRPSDPTPPDATVTVSRSGIAKLMDAVEYPKQPTEKLKELMREHRLGSPDATAQREAIARIIDPEAWTLEVWNDNWIAVRNQRKEKARAKADAILAQTRAGG